MINLASNSRRNRIALPVWEMLINQFFFEAPKFSET
jgi:hypothetical protein